MSNDETRNVEQPRIKPLPPLPQPPKKPDLQISNEDFKAPLPDKTKLLNEGWKL